MIREVRASGGFLSFDAPTLDFGLGACTEASMDVRWTDGTLVELPAVPVEQHLHLVRR